MTKCKGCGATLQSLDKEKKGYYPQEKKDAKYCERCFKIINYNKDDFTSFQIDEEKLLKTVNEKASHVFFLIDFLQISNETIEKFKRINKPKVLVISKCDNIPKNIKINVIEDLLRKEYEVYDDIIFLSAVKGYSLSKILTIIKNNQVNESYILGYSNAGKSSLINGIIAKYNIKKEKIATSCIPNTTLDFIKIKINDITLVDTPGFNLVNPIYKDDINLVKKIITKKRVNPITYQTKEETIINIEDKVLIKLNNINSAILYMSNNISVKKDYKLDPKDKEELKLDIDNNTDVLISGLGFINIKKKTNLLIYTTNKKSIQIRKSIFRGEDNE